LISGGLVTLTVPFQGALLDAAWAYTYDLLGRRLTASDLDLGAYSCAYDGALAS